MNEYDDIVTRCRNIRKWTTDNATSQNIEALTTGRMRIVANKARIGEVLSRACMESASAEKRRRYIEDSTRYKSLMETDVTSKADVVAKNASSLQRGNEILAIGEEKAIRVLWSDLGDILDALNQRIATLRSEWNDRNKQPS
jgi:hypothetical protein